MKLDKAVITAAAPHQRELPTQTLVGPDGRRASVLHRLVDEALRAGASSVGVVLHPDDRELYSRAAGEHAPRCTFLEQDEPAGYAHALLCAREFAEGGDVLHLVGDHVWSSDDAQGSAQQLAELARAEDCSISAVQPTRERDLADFGAVGGAPLKGREGVYAVERVLEKPSPTVAEEELFVPGLRAGHYLCFFGVHALSAGFWPLLEDAVARGERSIAGALGRLGQSERYLAFVPAARRWDVGSRWGLLVAQLALALKGEEREEVLAELVELLAQARADRGA